MQNIVNVPNYQKVFSYIGKGIPLYWFNQYQTEEIVDKLHAINILSHGLKLYEKVEDRETALSWIESGHTLKTRGEILRTKEMAIEYLDMQIEVFKEV